jgi:uncharacterized protein (TIGR02266 family)
MSQHTTHDEEERALQALGPAVAAIDDARVVRPSADPHAAAATALLVADWLAQPELEAQVRGANLPASAVAELRDLSRAIMAVVTRLGGDYLPDAKGIPGDLVARGESVRTSIAAALDKALPEDPEVLEWLEAIRLGTGVVDLVYDLRTLGEICSRKVAQGDLTGGSARAAVAAADAVEFALRTADTAEQSASRNLVARLWTLFVPAYERAAAAGRALTRSAGKERQFPPLALVASHRRASRRPVSLVPPVRRSGAPGTNRSSRPPPPLGSAVQAVTAGTAGKPLSIPPNAVPHDVAMVEMDGNEPEQAAQSSVPHPATAAERNSWTDTRTAHRHIVESEVVLASDGNRYVGFTENLSPIGVFVATYAARPIGTRVEIVLEFPDGGPLTLKGAVRWVREATTDRWPGLGVQLDALTPDDEAKIRKFLSLRDPLFYDGPPR